MACFIGLHLNAGKSISQSRTGNLVWGSAGAEGGNVQPGTRLDGQLSCRRRGVVDTLLGARTVQKGREEGGGGGERSQREEGRSKKASGGVRMEDG